MSTAAKSTSKTAAKAKSAKGGASDEPHAIKLLKSDHREVEAMFKAYEDLETPTEKAALVEQIVMALKVHTQIEEEIFYPAGRGEVEDDLLDEAEVEHAGAKDLIAQLEAMTPEDDLYDAKVTVLGEYVRHHVKEEEEDMFKQAKKGDMDLDALGEQMLARKAELTEQMLPAKPN